MIAPNDACRGGLLTRGLGLRHEGAWRRKRRVLPSLRHLAQCVALQRAARFSMRCSKEEVSEDEIAETCSASPCVVRPTMCGGAGRLRLDWATSALPCGNNLLVHLHKNR